MSYTGINKSVLDKLPKQEVELSKMEVELATIKELDSLSKQAEKMFSDSISEAVKKAEALATEIATKYAKPLNETSADLYNSIFDLKKRVKEIGLSESDVPEIKKAEEVLNSIRAKGKTLSEMASKIRNAY